ncbi:unnamed protein product [Nezara viridula]|uniref:Uncharacterized protein n=1 Tax=Nezara viridula TaxID=85310 RepID=A0A9P0ECU8_NEZVI|nr:unnamed protein product [Nezara viridula]
MASRKCHLTSTPLGYQGCHLGLCRIYDTTLLRSPDNLLEWAGHYSLSSLQSSYREVTVGRILRKPQDMVLQSSRTTGKAHLSKS